MELSVRKKRKNRIRRLIAPNTINRLLKKRSRTKNNHGLCSNSSMKAAQVCLKKQASYTYTKRASVEVQRITL